MFILLYSILIFINAMFIKIISSNNFIKFSNLILVFIYAYFAYSDPSNAVIISLLVFSIYVNLAFVSYMVNDNFAIFIKKILKKWKSLFKCAYSFYYYIGMFNI